MEGLTREEELEYTFLQFIELVTKYRYQEKMYAEHFGVEYKRAMISSRERLDKVLETMGVAEATTFKRLRISFFEKVKIIEPNLK